MNWPTPTDFNDAIRNPADAFTDPDLANGETDVGSDGRPLALSGDSSRVYQVCGEDGRIWAVKCFTRPVPAIAERYGEVRAALDRATLPCTVPFTFLADGLRVNGESYPVVKMEWVEGLQLNRVAGDRADSAAVMDGLFKRWVQLCRELRAAGIAHTDLQHGSAILVPGNWPGSYTLKLIDYDAMCVPALAEGPAEETGHPNYQHPARAADTPRSADLDRFPHLVIATALKALAVHGPRLWQRYDKDDNLLFTAADFHNPAGSALVQELWKTQNPALRKLVGKLVIACGQPIPETPWLDDLAAELDVPLTAEETKAVDDVLGTGQQQVAPQPEPANVIPVTEAFTLDDEPPPAPKPAAPIPVAKAAKAAVPARAKPASKPAMKPLPLDDDEVEEEEEPRPRAKKRRKEEPARKFPVLLVAIVAGLVLLGAGVGAGILIANRNKPTETVQPQPEDPKPQPPQPGPGPGPQPPGPGPKPPGPPEPPPGPPAPPPFMGPPEFHQVWTKAINDERANVRVFFAADGRSVFVANNQKLEMFDAKTGNAGPELRGQKLAYTMNLWTLDRDRIVAFGFPLRAPALWDAKTGDPLPATFSEDPLPPAPAGVQPTSIECQVSPDGKYAFLGYQGPFRGGDLGSTPAPYRVIEAGTGKVIAQGDWSNGSVRFTADGSRMLMAETNGRVRWIKTATGATEIEWAFQANGFPRMIDSVSADGSLFVYFGKPPGLQFDRYLIDGKTGQVLRKVPATFHGERAALTADGKWLVGVANDPNELRKNAMQVTDARSGEVLVRTQIDGTLNDIQRVGLTPDGKALIIHHRGKHEVMVYELRGAVPAATTPAPAPLTGVPERAQPGAPVVGPGPIPPPPPPPPPPGAGLPAAAELKARWSVATETGIQANQISQNPIYSKDGKTIILSGGNAGTILTFDAKTGAAGAVFDGHKGPGGVHWMLPFGENRVVSGGFDAKQATWDTKTGKKVDDTKFVTLPPWDPQRGHAGITHAISPNGRYTAIARKEVSRPGMPNIGQLRLLDTTTEKELLKLDWNGGQIHFTADESRMFVINGLGKAKWYKLPSGEADGEWNTGEGIRAEQARVLSLTTDGRTMLYYGPLADQGFGVYILDAKTGQVARKLGGAPYQALWSALSPDGRYAVMGVIDFTGGVTWYADVFEVSNWKLLGRVSAPQNGTKSPPYYGFSPDSKELAIFYPQAKELKVVTLPEVAPR